MVILDLIVSSISEDNILFLSLKSHINPSEHPSFNDLYNASTSLTLTFSIILVVFSSISFCLFTSLIVPNNIKYTIIVTNKPKIIKDIILFLLLDDNQNLYL